MQDEFVYILEGRPTLVTDAGRTPLAPGMCAGFKGGSGDAHHLVNETDSRGRLSRNRRPRAGDAASYPDDDIEARSIGDGWAFTHKDGKPY